MVVVVVVVGPATRTRASAAGRDAVRGSVPCGRRRVGGRGGRDHEQQRDGGGDREGQPTTIREVGARDAPASRCSSWSSP